MGTYTQRKCSQFYTSIYLHKRECTSAYRNKPPWRFEKNGLALDAQHVIFRRFHDSSVNFMIFDHVISKNSLLGTNIER